MNNIVINFINIFTKHLGHCIALYIMIFIITKYCGDYDNYINKCILQ
jgi:hypothetical protein